MDDALELSLEAYERACIERALREAGRNGEAAAALLGISKSAIYRKMRRLGIPPPTKRIPTPAALQSPF